MFRNSFLIKLGLFLTTVTAWLLWSCMIVNAPTDLSLTGWGFLLRTPEEGGAGHSLIWSKICAAEQDLVLRVLSIKHVIQFHYLASSTREVILEKKPLKDCNGSREAVYIQTRYFSISFAKKNTNKQTERTLTGTPQQLWPITAGSDTYIKKNKKY